MIPGAVAGADVVTVGESLVLLAPAGRVGSLADVRSLDVTVGGAESNVAIGVARLGWRSAWLGRVGDDSLGRLVVATLRGQGVDVHPTLDPAPTSIMLKERRLAHLASVVYYRASGPGSHLTPDDVDAEVIGAARLLHVTGITPALSDSAAATVHRAVTVARDAGVTVSFDVNYRTRLWPDADAARSQLLDLVGGSDIVFAGDDEARRLGIDGSPAEQSARLLELGPSQAIVKLGPRGAVGRSADDYVETPSVQVPVVDAVGAGDAFVAGYLSGVLAGSSMSTCLDIATRCGAFAVATPGDWEGTPFLEELSLLSADPDTILR